MEDNINEILNELRQICRQYKDEVPGKRRAWPRSVKERVFGLQAQGLSARQIADQISIPCTTILSWNSAEKKRGNFLPVKVVRKSSSSTVTVGKSQGLEGKRSSVFTNTTVTVVSPRGIRVEGMPLDAALSLIQGEMT
jgi:hypothetical protein